MKRTFFCVAVVFAAFVVLVPRAEAQWTLDCSTSVTDSGGTQGVLQMRSGSAPQYCYYAMDSLQLKIFTNACQSAAYTYSMTAAERSAYMRYVWATPMDFTGDGINEIILMTYTLSGSVLRSAIKVLDITSGATLLERRNTQISFTCYPYNIGDLNGDGIIECLVNAQYVAGRDLYSEVYDTGVAASGVPTASVAPQTFQLAQNYPNPFNPTTRIEYSIAAPGHVSLEIFNISGQKVTSLVNSYQTPGMHTVEWTGADERGIPQASGSYLYQVSIDGKSSDARKMILLR
ncbi:MAG TPA: T9SS type A sorting domain-containing protein [bacterium]|jgi:hypothetical protein